MAIVLFSNMDGAYAGVFESMEALHEYMKSKKFVMTKTKDENIYHVEDEHGGWIDDYGIDEYQINTRFFDKFEDEE